jgi:hypothetical protein
MVRLDRRLLYAAATSDALQALVCSSRKLRGQAFDRAGRFVAGESLPEALAAVRALVSDGFAVSVDLFGENVDDQQRVMRVVDDYCELARAGLDDGCIFHSDRGGDYTSAAYGDKLASLGIRQSVGRTGVCYDNALAESFFATLKNELVNRTVYPTKGHARRDIRRCIELRCNTRRIHSALDYQTPNEVYNQYLNRAQAA